MHTNTLAEYEEMLPTSRWNLARKRRLSKWLKRHNYYKYQACDDLNRKINLAQKSEESSTAILKQEIDYFREFNLGRYEEPEKAMVEELFGKYGVPSSVTDGYEEAAKSLVFGALWTGWRIRHRKMSPMALPMIRLRIYQSGTLIKPKNLLKIKKELSA